MRLRQIREKSFTEWLVFQQRNLDRQSLIDVFFFLFIFSSCRAGCFSKHLGNLTEKHLERTKFRKTPDLILLHCTHQRSNAALKDRILSLTSATVQVNRAYRQRDEGERLRDTSLASINASETSLHLFFMSCTSGFRNKSSIHFWYVN